MNEADPSHFVFEPLPCAPPFHGLSVSDLKFPLAAEDRDAIRSLVLRIVHAAQQIGLSKPALCLDTKQLHHDGGSKLYSAHARKWSPRMGFCFDPAARPPRKLELSDLMDMEYGSEVRLDDRSCIHVSRSEHATEAYSLLAGRGIATLLFFRNTPNSEQPGKRYLEHTREHLLKYMAPGQFQSFPFYLPLLSSTGISGATAEQLQEWMGETDLYLRESPDSSELIFVTRGPCDALLESAGMTRLGVVEGDAPWRLEIDQRGNHE